MTSVLALFLVAALVMVGAPAHATFAGRNGLVAFTRSGNIFTATATGGSVTQVTTTGGLSGPKWSPDGTRLAYKNGSGSVFVRTMSSGRTVRVGTGAVGPVSWTADGVKVAWIAEPVKNLHCTNGQPLVGAGVYSAPADASQAAALLYDFHAHGWTDCDVKVETLTLGGFGADGRTMSFTMCSSFGSAATIDCGTWVETAPFGDGSSRMVLGTFCYDATFTPPCTWLSNASSAPAGTALLFSGKGADLPGSSDTAAERIYTVDSSGTGLHQVSTATSGYNPTWSPSGTTVLFTQRTSAGTSLMKVSGTAATATPTVFLANASQADWQPLP